MRINNNVASLNTYNKLSTNQTNTNRSLEKLSSGLRINKAGDDAAGLAISAIMRAQVRGLNQAARNAQDGISMIQTAEGALNETHSILQRMRELGVQASNDTLQAADRTAIGEELKALATEIDRIGNDTEFNGKKLLNGSLGGAQLDLAGGVKIGTALATTIGAAVTSLSVSGAKSNETYTFSNNGGKLQLTRSSDSVAQSITIEATLGADGKSTYNFDQLGISLEVSGASTKAAADIITDLAAAATIKTLAGSNSATFAIGANAGQTMTVAFSDMRTTQLGGASPNTIDELVIDKTAANVVAAVSDAQNLITQVDAAITQVSTQRGVLGAAQNRLEHTINNLNTSSENVTAAESRIRDVDMAAEMMNFTKNNILSQAATAMLAQANQQPQGVLQLLR